MKALLPALLLLPWHALAHEGHGQEGISHWHATDLLLPLALAAGLLWFLKKRK
ncbi:hypothetical protein ABT392_22425 [Paucibacter sp. JuS9]|uniref:hypothetical protein n=1 Tax=Paucibacter sp. JuS9 TaxID=3228748 RepID=UPI00375672B3